MKSQPTLEMVLGHEFDGQMDPQFKYIISIPIERGGLSGIAGNGKQQLQIRELVKNGRGPAEDWVKEIGEGYVDKQESLQLTLIYFQCPNCDRAI
jgi:hypothetical protein